MQRTLKEKIEIKGIGLHSGCDSTIIIEPAAENSGISFQRCDVENSQPIRALYSNVVDTRNCTCLGDGSKNIISTIEHLMATLYILGIDNASIKVNNPEIPILDGSSKEFLNILKNVELVEQKAQRKYLKVKKRVIFQDDKGNSVTLLPNDKLHVSFDIEFPSKIVGHQHFDEDITLKNFSESISQCRTFCEKYQVDYLKSIGLIKGGSLDNAIVLDGDTLLNPDGFRTENECVKHKVIDTIGDLYTSGYFILGKVIANKSGHYHNNGILKELFSSEDNYELV